MSLREQVLEKLIREFKLNYSYRLHKEIQDSRTKMRLFNVDDRQYKVLKKFEYKNLFYDGLYKDCFIMTDFEIISNSERYIAKRLTEYKFKFIDLSLFKLYFDLTLDIFVDGLKVPEHQIQIMYTDYNIVLKIPFIYYNYTDINILTRRHFYDIDNIGYGNTFKLDKNETNKYKDMPFLTYVNGELFDGEVIKNFTIDDELEITVPTASEECFIEIIFTPLLFQIIKSDKIDLKYFNTIEGKFPISKDSIMTFINNRFIDLELQPVTSNVFHIPLNVNTETLMIFVFYDESEIDINDYRDKVEWYRDNYDIISDLTNNLEPEYVREHILSDIDLSMSNQVDSKLNNEDYLVSKFKDIIKYDYEFYDMYINEYIKQLGDQIIINSELDMKDFNYESLSRMHNRGEIINKNLHKDFVLEHILLKIPNPSYSDFNIIIDGITDFDFLRFDEDFVSNVYVRKSKIKPTSIIEVETFNCNRDVALLDIIMPNSASELVLNNASFKKGLNHLKLFRKDPITGLYNPTNIIKEVSITSAGYTKIEFTETIPKGENIRLLNHFANKKQRFIFKKLNGESITLELPDIYWYLYDEKHFRIYKNGRVLPRKACIFTKSEDGKVHITVNARFVVGEVLTIEHLPDSYNEIYYEELIDEYGRIRLDKGILNTPFNYNLMKYYLNGKKLNKEMFDKRCNNGMLMVDAKSRRHFVTLINERLYNLISEFSVDYNTGRDLYDEFIKSIMEGKLIVETEPDILDVNTDRAGRLYYDLYQEFLKHNLADPSKPIPEYILIKYKDLVTDEKILYISSTEKYTYWMPLDAKMEHLDAGIKIDELYYKLLDDMKELTVIDSADIPHDIYIKYKELFDGNTLVLDFNKINR